MVIKMQKNKKTLDIVLIIIGVSTFIFTVIMCVFFAMFQQIPDVLCERFYTCVVGELGATGLIQVVKTICKYKYPNLNQEDESFNEEEEMEINDEGVDLNE